MLVTVLRSQFTAPSPQGLHIFLGCRAPDNMPAGKVISVPQLDEAALQNVLALEPPLFREGVTVVVDDAADATPGAVLESMQKHIALLYCKFFFMPLIRNTIPDVYGIRKESTQAGPPFLPHRIVTLLRNIPLYLTSPLTEALERRAVGCPVYIVLGGPSLRDSGEALRKAARHCAVVCVARTLDFCLEQGVEPDFVITLDTDWRYAQLLAGPRLKHTWLISLSACNIGDVASRFAGVFFMESFHTGVLRKKYRMRESWMSVAICTLGLAEVLHAPQIIVSGGDGCWSADTEGYVGYFDSDAPTRPKQAEDAAPAIALPVSGGPREKPKRNFVVSTVGGDRAQTSLVYYSTTAELDGIAREFRQRGVQCWQVGRRGILNPSLYAVLDAENMHELEDWSALDRAALHENLRLAHLSPLPLSFEGLDALLFSQRQLAEQCHMSLLVQLHQGEDVSQHPFIVSMELCAEQLVFPNFLTTAARAQAGLALCEYCLRLQRRAKAYMALFRCRREGKSVRLACHQDDVGPLLQSLHDRLPGLQVEPVEVTHWMLDPMSSEDALRRELFSGVLCDEYPALIAPNLWPLGQDVWPCLSQEQYLQLDDVLQSLPLCGER